MKRLLTTAAAAAVLVAGTGSGAQAQAGASLFDLGIYGGAGYNYQWLNDLSPALPDGGTRLNPGWAPAMGAQATFWATPRFGVRTHVGYQWLELPAGSVPNDLNLWMYDLNLVMRPFIARSDESPRLLNSLYLFLGGGGLTSNPPGEDGCASPYVATYAACLPIDWSKGTVGQGTAGLGWDVISITDNIGLFTEVAGNIYDSPFHEGAAWTGRPENDVDSYGLSGRIVAGLKFSFGSLEPEVVAVPVAPAPPPPAPPPPPPPPPPPADREISVCVIEGNTLRTVTARYNPTTGDTMVTGREFAAAYPATAPTYAAGANWFISTDSVTFNNQQYVKFGVTRVIQPSQLTRAGEFQGTGVWVESGGTAPYQVLYVPTRPGCEFQPYQMRAAIRPRG